ncbi:Eukaryotic translation initiation factor 3 subunit J [Borealophlyctis nickersoniae]|nr:Eukaryotic translation initiation factor 3 subunit J [Borealophlyctis nickersoniae]
MADWDDEDIEVKVPVIPIIKKGDWDDEDAEDEDVKAAWDDDDEEEEKPAPKTSSTPTTPPTPAKKKQNIKKTIAAKKEEEERKKRELAAKRAEDEFADETPEERKLRLQKQVMEADFEHTKDLFGGISSASANEAPASSKMESMNPDTKADFDEYVKVVMEKFSTFEKSSSYSYFVETLLRDLLVPLNVDDTRRISSSLTAMLNEKQKASKDAKKKKGGKGALKTGPKGVDTTNYDDVYDEFEDFM